MLKLFLSYCQIDYVNFKGTKTDVHRYLKVNFDRLKDRRTVYCCFVGDIQAFMSDFIIINCITNYVFLCKKPSIIYKNSYIVFILLKK